MWDDKGTLIMRDEDNGRYRRDCEYFTHRRRSQLTSGAVRGNSVPLHSCSRRDFALTDHWHMPSYSYVLHALPMRQVYLRVNARRVRCLIDPRHTVIDHDHRLAR